MVTKAGYLVRRTTLNSEGQEIVDPVTGEAHFLLNGSIFMFINSRLKISIQQILNSYGEQS